MEDSTLTSGGKKKPMKTKTKWRLGQLPDPEELVDLVKSEILTKEEAREILITQETEEDRDKNSLQAEIKFLRKLVERLSENQKTEIVRHIEYIEKPYKKQEWFQPYYYYCSGTGTATVSGDDFTLASNGSTMMVTGAQGNGDGSASYTVVPDDFSNIKTF